ncbi:MAG: DUF1266 domain-containing protein [Eubacteriales bacterium]
MGVFDFLGSNKQKDEAFVVPKTEQERWCLDTYSIWCASTGGDASKLSGRFSKKSASTVLKRDWGVSISAGCGEQFLEDYIKPTIVMQSEDKGEISWEYGCCAQLLCLAYAAELITREQHNEQFFKLAKCYQLHFTSWEEMAEQYFIGYENATGNIAGVNMRKETYKELKAPNSLNFKVDWNISF